MDDWDFTHPLHASRYETSDLGRFTSATSSCLAGLLQRPFDIIGHIDVVKFGHRLSDDGMEPIGGAPPVF